MIECLLYRDNTASSALQVVNTNRNGCTACPPLTWPARTVRHENKSMDMVNETELQCVSIAPTALHPGEPVALVLVLLSTGSAIVGLAVIGFYAIQRNHRLIKATSRELSIVVIVGEGFCL